MNEGLKEYPQTLLKKVIKKFNPNMRLAPVLSEAFPEYPFIQNHFKTVVPPGCKNVLDDLLSGFASNCEDNGKNLYFISLVEKPKLADSANKGDINHELTHDVDKLFKNIIGTRISGLESFKKAVKKDLSKFSERKSFYPKIHKKYGQSNINYILKGSTPDNLTSSGLNEIFAESGMALTTKSQT